MKKARLIFGLLFMTSIGLTGCSFDDISNFVKDKIDSSNKEQQPEENSQDNQENNNPQNGDPENNENDPENNNNPEEKEPFTVYFMANGGVLAEGMEVQTVRSGDELVPPTFIKDAYSFNGWDKNLSEIAESCEVNAQWTYTGIGECKYTLDVANNNESYFVSGVYDFGHETYNIYSTFMGLPVTKISGAFRGCEFTSVTIPDFITVLGADAFFGCPNLETVIISDSVTFIGYGAFWNCSSLVNLTLSNNLVEIQPKAFANCESLKVLNIPASVTRIRNDDVQPFFGCESLETINVDPSNPVYHSDGNCLIETSVKTLVSGCKTSIIPNDGSVTKIGDCAFQCMNTLGYLEIPEAVTEIGSYAFWLSSIQKGLILGCGEKNFDNSAFDSCFINCVFYKGTQEEWDTNVHDNSSNHNLLNAERYYYSEEYPEDYYADRYWRYVNGEPTVWERLD